MIKLATRALGALFALVLLTQIAAAQFVEQRVWGGTSGGTANAQTLTIQNWPTTPITGVPVRFLPGATNTGATTLNISGSGAYSVYKASPGGPVALTGSELSTTQPSEVIFNGTVYVITSSAASTISVTAANLGNSTFSYGVPLNLQINATVGSNQLTIAIVGNNGSNASSSNPIPIAFRDTTIANGDPVIVSLQSSLSFTIGSGDTMGCVSGQMCKLWVWAINNGGTAALCAYNSLSGTNIVDLSEAALQTSGSGSAGGSSAQTLYCSTSSVTAKAVRRLGYIEIQEVTAGTWATGPTTVQLFGPGVARPGQTVQGPLTASSTSSTSITSSSYSAIGNTENISPLSASDVIEVDSNGTWEVTTSSGLSAFIQLTHTISASTSAIGNPYNLNQGSGTSVGGGMDLKTFDVPNTTGAVTYGTQAKTNTGTVYWPPVASGIQMILKEIAD